MSLSDVKIRTAKATATMQKLSDGEGLQLWISPVGGKAWKLAYRFGGKQKKLSLGNYPDISLQRARELRADAKRTLAEGRDSGELRRIEKLTAGNASANTFNAVADELLERKRREGRTENTIEKIVWILDFARPVIGERPISEITAAEVLQALRAVEARGRLETARRMRSVVGEVFRFAIATARATNDPTFALRGALMPPKVQHRAALVAPADFGALLRAIDGFNGQPTTTAALKLLALLFPRPGELRLAEWQEFNLPDAVWVIPAARTKMRREHRVPLSKQAVGLLRELHAITGRGKLVFPGYGVGSRAGKPIEQRPISENTLNGALRRMGYGQDEMTAHGFRSTASTLLNECGLWSADAIERALAHVEQDDVRKAYNRAAHWDERVRMAQWWADHLDSLRDGAQVIEFKPARA